MEHAVSIFRETRDALRAPVEDVEVLVGHLQRPLRCLGLLAGSSAACTGSEIDQILNRHISNIQLVLIEHVIPTWLPSLQEQPKYLALLEAYFHPDTPTSPTEQQLGIARGVALSAYLTLVPFLAAPACPPQSKQYVVRALARLSDNFPIDSIYWSIWGSLAGSLNEGRAELRWEEALKAVVGLPAKVANVVGARNREFLAADELPAALVPKSYFSRMLVRVENLLFELSLSGGEERHLRPLSAILIKLQRQGLLSPPKPPSPSSTNPSFWSAVLPSLLSHLYSSPMSSLPAYGVTLIPSLFCSLPAPILAQYCNSLLLHLSHYIAPHDIAGVKKASTAFTRIMGPATEEGEVFDAVCQNLTNARTAESGAEVRARIVVAWVAAGGAQVVKAFIDRVFAIWTDAKYIKFSLFSRQKDVTHHLLLALSRLPQYNSFLISLSRCQPFLLALSGYLSHPDASIRRLGMLVAEAVSEMTIEETEENPMSVKELQAAEAAEMEAMAAGLEGEEALPKPSSKKSAKRLRFGAGMWDGQGDGKDEARWLREELTVAAREQDCNLDGSWDLGWTIAADSYASHEQSSIESLSPAQNSAKDTPVAARMKPRAPPTAKKPALIQVIGDDDDDPMLGYAPSSPHSSRSASPTQEYLDEIKEDPTLHTGMKDPVKKPVYIQQLVDLLRERDTPEKVERGLADGEKLIRAKRNFGTELEENAELLATMAVALSESFGLDKFEEKREGLLIALVACAPKKAAPYLIEQYFDGQFSLHQRAVILSALALGGREAAGLPNPRPQVAPRIDFPSKALPPALHRKYITAADIPAPSATSLLEAASDDLRQLMISKGARGSDSVPEFVRERRLRVKPSSSKVTEVSVSEDDVMRPMHQAVHAPIVPFKDVAAEHFLLPMINRFWQHFQDASTRESRALSSGNRYRGAGTGMVLSPMALEKYLTTLGLLMHAARHASVFLSVLCPEALDLAATIGTGHLTRPDDNADGAGPSEDAEGSKLESAVVGAALELALITLDSAQELDGGRTLATDKGTVVMGVGEWASAVFAIEERGGEVASGAGGLREGRVRKAAAGVVVRVSEMMEKWRGRMGLEM